MTDKDGDDDNEPDGIDPVMEKLPPKKKGGGRIVKAAGMKPKHRADKMARSGKAEKFNPGGKKGKLHREMGIPEKEKIPAGKLRAAAHSSDPEKRRDAIRAETMKKWNKK